MNFEQTHSVKFHGMLGYYVANTRGAGVSVLDGVKYYATLEEAQAAYETLRARHEARALGLDVVYPRWMTVEK